MARMFAYFIFPVTQTVFRANILSYTVILLLNKNLDVVNLYQKLMLCRTIQAVSPNWTARQRSYAQIFYLYFVAYNLFHYL